jgi:hypothetical protein
LLLAVAALLLAACGSDSDPSGAGESGPDVTFATTPADSTPSQQAPHGQS